MKPLPILELFGEWRALWSLNKSCERKIPFMKTRWWILASYLSIVKTMHHWKWLHLSPNLQGENGENKIQKDTALKKNIICMYVSHPPNQKRRFLFWCKPSILSWRCRSSIFSLFHLFKKNIQLEKKNPSKKKWQFSSKPRKTTPNPSPKSRWFPHPFFWFSGTSNSDAGSLACKRCNKGAQLRSKFSRDRRSHGCTCKMARKTLTPTVGILHCKETHLYIQGYSKGW